MKESKLEKLVLLQLDRLKRQNLLRSEIVLDSSLNGSTQINGKRFINFCSNDYLGLAKEDLPEDVLEEVLKLKWGSTGSRLLTGTHNSHKELEEFVSDQYNRACMFFNSGYHLNTGVIPAITSISSFVVISDQKNHASIIDGIRLSGTHKIIIPHNDMNALEDTLKKTSNTKEILYITEGIFSIDGDKVPIKEVVDLKKRYGFHLMIDEAHSFGVCGKRGLGIASEYLEHVDLLVITLGKAAATVGAFLICSPSLKQYLISTVRSYIFSTSLPPALVNIIRYRIKRVFESDDKRRKLRNNINTLRRLVKQNGLSELFKIDSQIVPVFIGDEKRALKISEFLFEKGIFIRPIRYPTVEKNRAMLRIGICADHRVEDLRDLIYLLKEGLQDA